ncbi:MAG TPA: PadR family transcriptional regulator [Albitalea sp.]
MAVLGELEQFVMLAVLRLGEDGAYGEAVRRELAQRAGRSASLSTVYVTLMRLQEKGLVRTWLGEPEARRGGKAKRLFAVTPAGVRELESAHRAHQRMWEGVRVREARG